MRLFKRKNKKAVQEKEYWVVVLHYVKCRSKITYVPLKKSEWKEDYVCIVKSIHKSNYSYNEILTDMLYSITKDFSETSDWTVYKIFRYRTKKLFLNDTVVNELCDLSDLGYEVNKGH